MKKLLFTFAGAAALAALAADPAARTIDTKGDISLVGFESYTADATVIGATDNGQEGNSLWTATGDDASLVKTYGGDNAATPSITVPAPFSDGGDKYLALDTNGSELQRDITTTVDADGTYIDTLVQFTPSESAPTGSDLTGAKLAIWLGVVNNVTNLYVQGNSWDFDGNAPQGTSQAYALTGATIEPGTWYRLTVKALPNILNQDSGMSIPAFQIFVDGTEMVLSSSPLSAEFAELLDQSSMYASADIQTAVEANKLVPSIQAEAGQYGATVTLSSVGFKGTGALDDFVVTTIAPDLSAPAIDFTLTWDGVTPVSYTIDGGTPVSLSGETSPFAVPGLTGGETVVFTFTNADGATKTMTATAADDGDIDAGDAVWAWADYLGDAVAGAYTIDDANDLDMLRKGVAAGLATVGETFKQTANIDMTSAGAFAGIGEYAKVPTAGTPFLGTYDGQGYTIANVTRAGENTQGIFNQVGPSGVIENLVVSNMVAATGVTGFGFAIVGNAGGGATLRNLTAAGTFASADNPGQHNMAGIVVRLAPGATSGAATTIDSCTNNATIYGKYTKLGGINAIVQDQTGFKDGKVVFVNCANNGTLVCKRTYADCHPGKDDPVTGTAGIVAYFSGTNVELTGCYSNGEITNADGANTDKDGALVGWTYGGTIKDNGGNSAPSNKKMIGTWGSATETGFLYATVDNGVATTVTTLAKDTEYLLEGNAAPTFELAADGDFIAFNTALGYTLDGTGITAAEGLNLTDATSGTVTTYTAAAPQQAGWVDDSTTVSNETAAAAYPALAEGALANANAGKLTDWAKSNNIEFADVVAAPADYVEAFMLNCAPTAVAVEAEKEAFKLNITMGADGTPVVTTPEGKTYNVTPQLKGSNDLSTWADVTGNEVTPPKFYKAVLSL